MKKRIVLLTLILAVLSVALVSSVSAAVEPGSFMEVYFNNPYADGRDATLQKLIIDEVEASNERVYITTYNFTDKVLAETLMDAVDRGVEVRIVIHGENAQKDIVREMSDAGVEIYEAVSDGLMHSKFIVLDNDRTISGSANMTAGSFFYDNNFMILIQSQEANRIFAEEFDEMFLDNLFGSNSPVTKAPGIIELEDGTKFLIRFSPEDGVLDTLLQVVGGAQDQIRMLAYSFAEDSLGQALVDRFEDGIDVTVIFEGDKAFTDKGGEAGFLKNKGVTVLLDGSDDALMHEKVIIIDENFVAAGSYNFTRSADTRNDEQILFISSAEIAEIFGEEFEKIYEEAK